MESRASRARALGQQPQPAMVAVGISQEEWDRRWNVCEAAWQVAKARMHRSESYSAFSKAWLGVGRR